MLTVAEQLEAADHSGHCHSSTQHHTLPMQVVCCRPRAHTGMHTSCGHRPATDHQAHFTECLAWYTEASTLRLAGGLPVVMP